MARVAEAFRRVRWSDGRLASYRQDRVALGLHLWSQASGITVTILWIASSSWAAWWVLIPASIANSVGFELVARNRMRRAVLRIEAVRGAEQAPVAEEAPVEVGLEDWINFKLRRFDDWFIRYCDRDAAKFMTRAETAKASGDQKSAAKYLRKAERERKLGERWRRAVGYDDRQS